MGKNNPRYANGNRRRKYRARFKAMGLPCAICGRPIHYDEPSDAKHPWSFVIDEIYPVSRFSEFGFLTPAHAAADWDNLQPAHWACNAKKSARTMAEIKTHKGGMGISGKGTVKNNNRIMVHQQDGDW